MLGPEAAVAAPPAADRVSALSRGVFQVLQASFDGAPTVIKLVGALDGCKKADGGESHDPHRAGRQVWAHGRGVHTTVGHLSSATVRGTNWRVRDRCDGSTWTQVIHGIVEVKDDATGQIVTLTAGEGHAAGP
jgi:hypothetical protein